MTTIRVALLTLLTLACSSSKNNDELMVCGPAGACATGLTCDSTNHCVQTGGTMTDARPAPDAVVATIDAPVGDIDAPRPDARPDAPPGDQACSGPDQYEPNDNTENAAPLAFAGQLASAHAGSSDSDEDWYSFSAPKSEPMTITVTYTVPDGVDTNLTLFATDAAGNTIDADTTGRSSTTQTLSVTFESTVGHSYRADVASDGDACVAYDLTVDTLSCTDVYEDNDEDSHAAIVTLGNDATLMFDATVDGFDPDWYQFAAPKSDPVQVTATYTRPAGDTADLALYAEDADGNLITSDQNPRTGVTEAMQVVFESAGPGSTYRIDVESDSDGVCAPYTVNINGLWCTDSAEDNDDFGHPAPLTAGPHTFSVTALDSDFFLLSSPPASGSCTVSYTVAAGSVQDLSIYLEGITGSVIAEDVEGRTGLSETARVTWTANDAPAVLEIDAEANDCTSYVVTCD